MEDIKEIKTIEELNQFFNSKDNTVLKLKTFDESGITKEGLELVEYLKKNLNKLPFSVSDIILAVPYEKILDEDMVKFYSFYMKLKETGEINLKICVRHRYIVERTGADYKEDIYWDFESIAEANKVIEIIKARLQYSNYSPLEKYAFIHDYVSNIAPYTASVEEKHSWSDKDQFFAGAYLKEPEVVCAGYSALMKEIIDSLDIPELKCKNLLVKLCRKNEGEWGGHVRCLVFVKDKKYGIEQGFVDDPTWDNGKGIHVYTHFAMSKKAFESNANGVFNYCHPEEYVYSDNKAAKEELEDSNVFYDTLSHGENTLDQKMIEKVYFTLLKNIYSNADFDRCYAMLQKLAKDSFKEQQLKSFDGNLKSENLMLSKEEAKEIFYSNKKEKDKDSDEIEC